MHKIFLSSRSFVKSPDAEKGLIYYCSFINIECYFASTRHVEVNNLQRLYCAYRSQLKTYEYFTKVIKCANVF